MLSAKGEKEDLEGEKGNEKRIIMEVIKLILK